LFDLAASSVDHIIDAAIAAARDGNESFPTLFDALELPLYVTDASGAVTYYNRACIGFAGRVPEVGRDQWCVTWKLYTTAGAYLPHEACPMAVAIREQRPVRGVEAVAERPDGSRRNFLPYPTPLLDDDGTMIGAVNLLVDVTEQKAKALRSEGRRFRRMSESITDQRTIDILHSMASEFDSKAEEIERLH
jgi:PAS domain-containing protein